MGQGRNRKEYLWESESSQLPGLRRMSEPRSHPQPSCVGQIGAGSPAWRCWRCIRGRSEVSTEFSRGARRCTLATKAMGPPATWGIHQSSPSRDIINGSTLITSLGKMLAVKLINIIS